MNDIKYTNDEKLSLKTVTGRRCLTKCYPKSVSYLHPVLLVDVLDRDNNSCAIDPVQDSNNLSKFEYGMIFSDKCNLENNNTFKPPNELESILLSFTMEPEYFLANIYDLHSFDQVIYWTIENDYLPFDTIKRVHNCAWKVYGNKVENLSNNILEYYYDICINYWAKDYAKSIEKKYSFNIFSRRASRNNEYTDSVQLIYDIIVNDIITYDFFVTMIKRYVYEYQDKWHLIDSKLFYKLIKIYIYQQLLEYLNTHD